jgi:transcriptional regulator with XRE-family HTH domain
VADPHKTALKDLGLRIKALRKERGITQEELAGRAELSRTYLTVLETGGKAASLDSLFRISKVLGVNPGELFLDPRPQPASTRAVVARIYAALLKSKKSAAELARLEQLVDTFLRS